MKDRESFRMLLKSGSLTLMDSAACRSVYLAASCVVKGVVVTSGVVLTPDQARVLAGKLLEAAGVANG